MNTIINPLNNKVYSIFSNVARYLSEQYVKLFQSGGDESEEEDEVILTGDKLRNIDEFKNMTIKDLLGDPPELQSTSSKNETSDKRNKESEQEWKIIRTELKIDTKQYEKHLEN